MHGLHVQTLHVACMHTPTPNAHAQVRSLKLFTEKQHINTVAPLAPNEVWVVAHDFNQVSGGTAIFLA